jgi:uncharacterized protein YecE (DUF72 family)
MSTSSGGILRVGTSNIVLPANKEAMPPAFKEKSRLSYYSSLFNTLEVNSTFRKIPRTSTLKKWSDEVSTDFQFTIKLWKEVTHIKKLEIDLTKINQFLGAVNSIGEKKGCLLVQFPGSITVEYYSKVEQILTTIRQADPESSW